MPLFLASHPLGPLLIQQHLCWTVPSISSTLHQALKPWILAQPLLGGRGREGALFNPWGIRMGERSTSASCASGVRPAVYSTWPPVLASLISHPVWLSLLLLPAATSQINYLYPSCFPLCLPVLAKVINWSKRWSCDPSMANQNAPPPRPRRSPLWELQRCCQRQAPEPMGNADLLCERVRPW